MTRATHDRQRGALYLIAGGYHRREGLHPGKLLASILADAGLRSPRVACVGSANGDDRGFFRWGAEWFKGAGAAGVTLAPTAASRADNALCRRILSESDIVFISGGDVEAGMRTLAAAGLVPLLRSLHRAGVPFAGLSAGSIMLGRLWVRWRDPGDDTTAEPFPCLGLAPLVCDTHGEDDAWQELLTLLRAAPARTVGYGIVSGAALRVGTDAAITAMGGAVHRFARRQGVVLRLPDLEPLEASGAASLKFSD